MYSNRVKFCAKEKKVEEAEPEFPNRLLENLTIADKTECDAHLLTTSASSSQISIRSLYSIQRQKFDSFFSGIVGEIFQLTITEKERNKIYNLIEKCIDEFCLLSVANFGSIQHKESAKGNLYAVQNYVTSKLRQYDSDGKREKELAKCEMYVPPIEKAIALKWQTKVNVKSGLPDHKMTQSTYQYIEILSTLKSLFRQPAFKKMYFENCLKPDHNCQSNIYRNFCCSSVCRNSDLYKDDKTAIRIQLGIDDFDPCDAMKSKSVVHKLSAVYFTVGNIPDECLSKHDNMHLVALCEVSNHKQRDASFDDILALIVKEIKELETNGIEVDGQRLHGSIVHITCDNLGANSVLGFVESFVSYFCRACEISKAESECETREDFAKMRTKQSYSQCVELARKCTDTGKKINFQLTKGVKKYSEFNELKYFHVVDNVTFDIMHDLNEGTIPFLLGNLFRYMIDQHILNASDIQNRILDFNYGELSKRNKPSYLNFEKKIWARTHLSCIVCLLIYLLFLSISKKNLKVSG